MNKTFDVFFDGTINTVTPFTFTAPTPMGKMPQAGLPKIGNHLYIPSTTIRGNLRRAARDEVQAILAEINGGEYRFSLEDFYLNTLGGVKGAKEKDGEEKEDKTAISRVFEGRPLNPLVSLFGAMAPSIIPGKVSIEHAIDNGKDPALPVLITHVRSNDLTRDPASTSAMLQDGFEAEYSAMMNIADARSAIAREIKGLKKQMRDATDRSEKDRLNEAVKEKEEEKKTLSVVQVSQILDYQVIPSGVTMRSNFRLMKVTEKELVLFLRAIDRMAANPVLGGRRNHGNGVIAGAWNVRVRESGARMPEDAGSISFNGDFSPAHTTGKISEWMVAELDLTGCNFSASVFKKAA